MKVIENMQQKKTKVFKKYNIQCSLLFNNSISKLKIERIILGRPIMTEYSHFPIKIIIIKQSKTNMINKHKLPIKIINLFKLQHQINLKINCNHQKRNK